MGAVIDGKYYPDETAKTVDSVSSTYKGWHHAEQRNNHARDIIQPYKNGKPNPDFIEAFPTESKEAYNFLPTDEQLKNKE